MDCTQDNPAEAYRVIRKELELYGGDLAHKKEVVVLTKMDALGEELTQDQADTFEKETGIKPMIMSAVAGQKVDEVMFVLAGIVDGARKAALPPPEPEYDFSHPLDETPHGEAIYDEND